MLGSLHAALADKPIEEWSFEARGEKLENFEEFQRLIHEAESISYGDFVARADGITVESS
ncbi:hypothetical protein [Kitasatospora kazusensis]|uniref:hypothetical protein n=1 Tax=Kitasatospora kazusensis TaxID=407974 RepID=UPI0031D7407A